MFVPSIDNRYFQLQNHSDSGARGRSPFNTSRASASVSSAAAASVSVVENRPTIASAVAASAPIPIPPFPMNKLPQKAINRIIECLPASPETDRLLTLSHRFRLATYRSIPRVLNQIREARFISLRDTTLFRNQLFREQVREMDTPLFIKVSDFEFSPEEQPYVQLLLHCMRSGIISHLFLRFNTSEDEPETALSLGIHRFAINETLTIDSSIPSGTFLSLKRTKELFGNQLNIYFHFEGVPDASFQRNVALSKIVFESMPRFHRSFEDWKVTLDTCDKGIIDLFYFDNGKGVYSETNRALCTRLPETTAVDAFTGAGEVVTYRNYDDLAPVRWGHPVVTRSAAFAAIPVMILVKAGKVVSSAAAPFHRCWHGEIGLPGAVMRSVIALVREPIALTVHTVFNLGRVISPMAPVLPGIRNTIRSDIEEMRNQWRA